MRRSTDPAGRQHLLAEWVAGTVREHELNATDGYVLMGLTLWADNDTGIVFPSKKTIAEHLGMGADAVKNSRERMVAAGVIEVVDNRGGKQGSVMRLVGYGDRHTATFERAPVSAQTGREVGTPRGSKTPRETETPADKVTPTKVGTPSEPTTRTTTSTSTKRSSTNSIEKNSKSTRARACSEASDNTVVQRLGRSGIVRRGTTFTKPRRYDLTIRTTLEDAGDAGLHFNTLSRQLRSTVKVANADAFEDILDDRLLYFKRLGVVRSDDNDRYWAVLQDDWPSS